jgi:hypothetical protein
MPTFPLDPSSFGENNRELGVGAFAATAAIRFRSQKRRAEGRISYLRD